MEALTFGVPSFAISSIWGPFYSGSLPFGVPSIWSLFYLETFPFGIPSMWNPFHLGSFPFILCTLSISADGLTLLLPVSQPSHFSITEYGRGKCYQNNLPSLQKITHLSLAKRARIKRHRKLQPKGLGPCWGRTRSCQRRGALTNINSHNYYGAQNKSGRGFSEAFAPGMSCEVAPPPRGGHFGYGNGVGWGRQMRSGFFFFCCEAEEEVAWVYSEHVSSLCPLLPPSACSPM